MHTIILPLDISKSICSELDSRFRTAEYIYNIVTREFKGRLLGFLQDKRFRELRDMKSCKERTKSFAVLEKEYGLRSEDYDAFIKPYLEHYSTKIDSDSIQNLAQRVRQSIDRYRFDNGKDIHFKKKNSLLSVEGKDFLRCIKFDWTTMTIQWKGLVMKLKPRKGDIYMETQIDELVRLNAAE